MPVDVMERLLRYRLFTAGSPTCCQCHFLNYFMVIYDLGDWGETQYKMSLN